MKRAPRLPRPCSRLDCPELAITRILQNGIQHAVCKGCWLTFMDQQDKLKVDAAAAGQVDFKKLAAGDTQ